MIKIKRLLLSTLIITLLFINSCGGGNNPTADNTRKDSAFSYDIVPLSIPIDSSIFSGNPELIKPLPGVTEASGIVHSLKYPGSIWTHEDSGSGPVIYLYDSTGRRRAKLILSSISATDYEDISLGYSLSTGKWGDIYLADIGDNDRKRSVVTVYSFPEPDLSIGFDSVFTMPQSSIKSIKITYPDEKNNAEALIVDPVDSAIYIFTKYNTKSKVYRLKQPFNYSGVNTPTLLGTLNIHNQLVTAADISDDGTKLVIKTYEDILFWNRPINEPITETLKRQPTRLPYIGEAQGEGFCWSAAADRYYTWSETTLGIDATINAYHKIKE